MQNPIQELITRQFEEHKQTIQNSMSLPDKVAKAAELIIEAFRKGNHLYACGNGGSTCDAMHFVEEFVGQYKNRRGAMPAHHLMDSSIMTCWSNDESYADVFRRQVEAYGKEGDVFVGISTGGNSENVLLALHEAKRKRMKTISFLGKDGGKMKSIADVDIIVPSKTTARIQEMHILCIHSILEAVDKEIWGV
ncbi:MAG TPA: SIS domain-containing protein [Candidatus Nanoarchaeia archaeon]|nr:SIS domain-containing protein [Candidatus Nanoarchaeia archaeon]